MSNFEVAIKIPAKDVPTSFKEDLEYGRRDLATQRFGETALAYTDQSARPIGHAWAGRDGSRARVSERETGSISARGSQSISSYTQYTGVSKSAAPFCARVN